MAPLTVFPQRHALNSTFTPPPLDGSLTVPEIYDWHLAHNPNHVLWRYSDDAAPEGRAELSFKQGVHAIHRAARLFTDRFTARGLHPATHDAPVIAIFAATDTITYFLCWLGLVHAGYVVCHISHRNSPAALAHILQKSNAEHVLVSGEPGVQAVVHEALEVHADKTRGWTWESYVSDMPIFSDIHKDEDVELMPKREFDLEARAYYIHSSGTTAFPKPISWSHKDFLVFSYSVLVSDHDFCDQVLACHSIPMFHGLGVLTTLFAACCGMTLSAFKPAFPATTMAPDNVFESAMRTGSTYVFCVPLFIEIWSRDPAKVNKLSQIKGILYGGGPLNKAVGDFMTQHGVNVYITYGASENGMKAPILPRNSPRHGLGVLPDGAYRAEFVPYGGGTYELVTIKCDTHSPLVFNTQWDGVPAYATSDLLIPHPTKEGFWKVFGRTDDQIMLSTGEKTNPGPLESILCQDPRVQAAVMFGRGRSQNGVVVQPKPDYVFDPANEAKLTEFRNAIWPTVERMNAYAPQHSRLFKEMILVMTPDKPFQYTAKGSVRRLTIIKDNEPEIEALYAAVAETTQEDIAAPGPGQWTEERARDFVRRTVHNVMKADLTDENDFFQYGCDSLQATWIRNTLARGLREAVPACTIPADIVYARPTIISLAAFAHRIASSSDTNADAAQTLADKTAAMRAFVDKYSRDIPKHAPGAVSENEAEGTAVLLTGTTGGLGASTLAELVALPTVRKVYALNRRDLKQRETLAARQRRALAERDLDADLVSSDKVVLLEADMTLPSLGLKESVVNEIHEQVTTIIHNAYRVDFNLSLTSFEPQLVILRNLINLALSSARATLPSVVFTSSVGVLRNASLTSPAQETALPDPYQSLGTGYTESKWVSEQVLHAAARASALRVVIVRVGQLSGTQTGAWNGAEWLPSLVASSPVLKCLPQIAADVVWLPLQAAGRAMAEIALASGTLDEAVLHLAHPQPVAWRTLFVAFAARLGVPLVPYGEWLQKMETSIRDTNKTEVQHIRENPALRLLAFFKGAAGTADGRPGYEAMGIPMMDMTRARAVVPSLAAVEPLGEADVDRWLAYWTRIGLVSS